MEPLAIVVLISGGGSNLQSIIDGIADKTLNARLCAVISNKAEAYGIERAKKANIPTEIIDHKHYDSRESFDAELTQCIEKYQPQLIVLAGFMRILTDDFVNHFYGKMINIHPSLLPKYRGIHTHKRALEAGDDIHGLSIHYVSAELDGGPIILQKSVPVLEHDSEASLAQRVLEQEHIAYPQVIQWIAEGRLQLTDNQVMMDGEPLTG
ncbi:MAG: phosphoribosylglycinamide formyltransferase [gamma proteobacterium symbiont of Bathyaustriella thionipta]|nr:phosphoribosylglycinamide formyltransferase [gamma proteobacterium symbiont of Bathyaustriella thionipta]MCU7949097.1 phosphoribosylglycinamide formyltransferase [gamma proteobacterium symbiont of Bathyaustriella thionipta]MCU7952793.1 phosphoribosylglycinamide formyltransferase [gamma proteobacterium symbiont of Bathyaustriella thionipta]MCU7955684.1 phosphoribosylglycinamide formyltransferase [gamma proteobacterium symbiont of Bathyaustriella thionipta]MCU7967998.1 phosphoribosylglycinamid